MKLESIRKLSSSTTKMLGLYAKATYWRQCSSWPFDNETQSTQERHVLVSYPLRHLAVTLEFFLILLSARRLIRAFFSLLWPVEIWISRSTLLFLLGRQCLALELSLTNNCSGRAALTSQVSPVVLALWGYLLLTNWMEIYRLKSVFPCVQATCGQAFSPARK